MSHESNMELLATTIELKIACDLMVDRLLESAGGDPVKVNTIRTIQTLFQAQSEVIANLMESHMMTGDFIEDALKRRDND